MTTDSADASRVEAAEAAAHHDDDGHGGGHGGDPNAGVLRGEPPTQAWVLTAVAVALVVLAVTVVLAVALARSQPVVPAEGEGGTHGLRSPVATGH